VTEKLVDIDAVTGNDIVFDCPECGKSLAIDQRGVGLMISCTDCKAMIQVPVPEGMELEEEEPEALDAEEFGLETETQSLNTVELTESEKDERIAQLELSLVASQSKVQELVESLKELYNRRNYLEGVRVENLGRSEKMGRELALIQDALDRIVSVMQEADVAASTPTRLSLESS